MDFECEGEPKTWPWFQNKGKCPVSKYLSISSLT